MAREYKTKGTIIGSITILINHKGKVAGVKIEGAGDLCTRQTLKSSIKLVDIEIMHSRSKRKRSDLDKMKADRIKENAIAKKLLDEEIAKELGEKLAAQKIASDKINDDELAYIELSVRDLAAKEDLKIPKDVKKPNVKSISKFITKKEGK